MKVYEEYSHNHADVILKEKGIYDEIFQLIDEPNIGMAKKAAPFIKQHVKDELAVHEWVLEPSVNVAFNLSVNAMKDSTGLMVQTGNITRAFYDLLKFQVMKDNNRIDVGVLIVPTAGAAKALGSNIANFTRVTNEIILFSRILNVPCLILGIDE
ncbi:BglII/BstYI family type II restriction endonuclease [Bacillus atrophaeus]|uniref:BglII/BstYI family type II restriction endonuclease n=1 Tax=Bacillus atrophaeus TaxID=1452 RepID=UPI001BAAE5C2|nr:BglII/BstYI family type II restriction endonuclease [Bacillus atrophaeus]MED4856266.1 BglII/BstYI family type II restriction endonuclease [Bacillus atrophaeus]QUF65362.1 hypothetical protein KCX77_20340 [Bacillus atrophaeus]